MLVMPLLTEAGLLTLGGSYGRGALVINDITVDYYSATKASVGVQLGAQQYSHVLFFMTPEALAEVPHLAGLGRGGGPDLCLLGRGPDLPPTRPP
jgi:lipid-binding SYLF domain-containing protein